MNRDDFLHPEPLPSLELALEELVNVGNLLTKEEVERLWWDMRRVPLKKNLYRRIQREYDSRYRVPAKLQDKPLFEQVADYVVSPMEHLPKGEITRNIASNIGNFYGEEAQAVYSALSDRYPRMGRMYRFRVVTWSLLHGYKEKIWKQEVDVLTCRTML